MKKNNLFLILFVFLTLINLASALSYGGSLSLGDLLNQIEPSTMILGIIFGVSFILISISLTRVFKENKTAAGALSLLVSLGIVWGINLTGMDYTGFFQNIFFYVGLPSGIIEALWPILLLVVILVLILKFKGNSVPILGAFLIFAGFFFAEGGVLWALGAGLILIWILMRLFFKRKDNRNPYDKWRYN
ncbi:MAG: hypothetical protein AABX28_01320 [Nanoarchaeota archaeon]